MEKIENHYDKIKKWIQKNENKTVEVDIVTNDAEFRTYVKLESFSAELIQDESEVFVSIIVNGEHFFALEAKRIFRIIARSNRLELFIWDGTCLFLTIK